MTNHHPPSLQVRGQLDCSCCSSVWGGSSTTTTDICSSEAHISRVGFVSQKGSRSGKQWCGWSRLMITDNGGSRHLPLRPLCCPAWTCRREVRPGLISILSAGCWVHPVFHHQLIRKEKVWAQETGRQKERKLSCTTRDGWMGRWMDRKIDGWMRVGWLSLPELALTTPSRTPLEK